MSSIKPLTPQQRQLKAVRDAVRKKKMNANLIKAPRSESDYYEEYYDEEGESPNSIDKEEESTWSSLKNGAMSTSRCFCYCLRLGRWKSFRRSVSKIS